MEEKRNKNAQQKGWKAMSNEVVKKPRGPKAFFKKVYRYRQFLIMLAPAVIYTLIFAYYPMTGIVLAFKKSHMLVVFGEVHGTDLRILISFLNLVRHCW